MSSNYNRDQKAHKKEIKDSLILSGYTVNYIRRALKVYERNYGTNYNTEVIAEIIRRLQKKDKNKARQQKHHPKSRSETFDVTRSFSPHRVNKNNKNNLKNNGHSKSISKIKAKSKHNGHGNNNNNNNNNGHSNHSKSRQFIMGHKQISHKSNRSYHSHNGYMNMRHDRDNINDEDDDSNDDESDEESRSDSDEPNSFKPPPINTQKINDSHDNKPANDYLSSPNHNGHNDDDSQDMNNGGCSPLELMERNWKKGDIVQYRQFKAEIVNVSDNGAAIEISYPLNGYNEYHRKRAWVGVNDIKFTKVLKNTNGSTTNLRTKVDKKKPTKQRSKSGIPQRTQSARNTSLNSQQQQQGGGKSTKKKYHPPPYNNGFIHGQHNARNNNGYHNHHNDENTQSSQVTSSHDDDGSGSTSDTASPSNEEDEDEEEDESEEYEDEQEEEEEHEMEQEEIHQHNVVNMDENYQNKGHLLAGILVEQPRSRTNPTASHTATSDIDGDNQNIRHSNNTRSHHYIVDEESSGRRGRGRGRGRNRTKQGNNDHHKNGNNKTSLHLRHSKSFHETASNASDVVPTIPSLSNKSSHRRSKSSVTRRSNHIGGDTSQYSGYYRNSHNRYNYGPSSSHGGDNMGQYNSEYLRIERWVNILRQNNNHNRNNLGSFHGSFSQSNTNPFHNDIIVTCEELKEYMIHNTPNWDLLLKYDVLNSIASLVQNILSKKYVNYWNKIISLSLDILMILIDYYLKANIQPPNPMIKSTTKRGGKNKKNKNKRSKKRKGNTQRSDDDDDDNNLSNNPFEYVIESIIKIMSHHEIILNYNIKLSTILISCCSILGKLTFENNGNIECVLRFTGIEQILNIIIRCYKNDYIDLDSRKQQNSVIISCLNLLCVLCYNSNYNKQFICNNGGSVAILDLLQYFISLKYHQKNKGKIQVVTQNTPKNKKGRKGSKRSTRQQQEDDDDGSDDNGHELQLDENDPNGIMSQSNSKHSKMSQSKLSKSTRNSGTRNNSGVHEDTKENDDIIMQPPEIVMTEEIIMMTSILRTLGNFTFVQENIDQLLENNILRILQKLVSEVQHGTDSNLLVLLMQILSDIGQCCDILQDITVEVQKWLISSILKLGRKNQNCILLQQCMLNAIAILINVSPERMSRILIQHKGESQIFERIKDLNYPENIVILSLRLIKSMCIHNDISSHLVKQSNVFNFLTHIMKHWRLKENHDNSLRIQCCCEVIRSLTTIEKFSKYANKCHVISGLIKILMLNDHDDHHQNDKIQPIVFIEILKTFISICTDEENCIKLAKHGTKCILSGIDIYSNTQKNHGNGNKYGHNKANHTKKRDRRKSNTSSSSLTSSSMTNSNTNYTEHNKFVQDIIKYIAVLFCNISKYESVCTYLYNYNAIEIAYNILAIYSQNVFICDQFISFLTNMLLSKHEVYHTLETKLHTQQLINKILYLHSNYDPLINTCHKYHKSIEIWLMNNMERQPQQNPMDDQTQSTSHNMNNPHLPNHDYPVSPERARRFPIFSGEIINNPYRIGDHIEFQDRDNMDISWVVAQVVDKENNWIIIRFINQSDNEDDSEYRNDRKIHVLKHQERLRFLVQHEPPPSRYPHHYGNNNGRGNNRNNGYNHQYDQQPSDEEEEKELPPQRQRVNNKGSRREIQKRIQQERQYEINVFLSEIQKFNWNLIQVSSSRDGKYSLYKCLFAEIYGISDKNGYKQIKKEVEEYKLNNHEYFKQFTFQFNRNPIFKDYMTMIAISELYNVRIRVFEVNLNKSNQRLILSFDCGDHQETMHLPVIFLSFLHGTHYHLIQDNSTNFHHQNHQRPLINYINNIQQYSDDNEDDEDTVYLIRKYRFRKFYQKLFDYFDENGDQQLNGEQIYEFFLSSDLKTDILRTIWDESVGDNCPTMNVEQFIMAMNLILREQLQLENRNKYNDMTMSIRSQKLPNGKYKVRKNSNNSSRNNNRNRGGSGPQEAHNRSSAPDAVGSSMLNAGIPNMKYPFNPFDINHLLNKPINHKNNQISASDANGSTQPTDQYISNNDVLYQNTSHGTGYNGHNGYNQNGNGLYMRQPSTDQQTAPTQTTQTTKTTKHSKYGSRNKQREFLNWYNQINFGANQELYYEKIAEWEYNNIDKMMELDREMLIEEFFMTADHATLFMTKLNKFIKKHRQFKNWLIEQAKMKKYFVKFVNEGILTFDIFLNRFERYSDLIPIIGDKNANDAKILFRKLPKNI